MSSGRGIGKAPCIMLGVLKGSGVWRLWCGGVLWRCAVEGVEGFC